jgi:uncharacterized protein with HEPN domain
LKDDRLYLAHIKDCIDRIEEYTAEGRDAFLADRKSQDAVLRNLQVMAESTQRISESLKALHPAIDWRALAGFRNLLVHDYLGVGVTRVWEVIEEYLPKLKREIDLMVPDHPDGPLDDQTL